MKTLPTNFVIKRDESNPLWKKYINWINGQSVASFMWDYNNYYWFDWTYDSNDDINDFDNNPTLITLEQWNECVDWVSEYREVYVSNESVEDALKTKHKRIFITELPLNPSYRYICVRHQYREEFEKWEKYEWDAWGYIAEIPNEELIEIRTTSWEKISITKKKARELWFNF
jgi:hypothetical protein